jgi:hypothetical protein
MNSQEILKILHDELNLAEEIETNVGVAPTAQEALNSVIDKITLLFPTEILVSQ